MVNGLFRIFAGTLPINNPITTGDAISGGEGASGGQGVNGGKASEGGTGLTGGDAVNGGDGTSTGDSITGGDPAKGGGGPAGGQGPTGGEGPSGGQNPSGDTITSGSTTSNNESSSSSSSGAKTENKSFWNILFNSTNNENTAWGSISQALKDGKTYVTTLVKPVLEGATATYAGFEFEKLGKGKYKVLGKSSLKNPILNHFYDNYKKYKIDGKDRYMKTGNSYEKAFKINNFFDTKKLTESRKDILGFAWKNLKSSMNDGYNLFSKKYWAKSNLAKLNGPISIAANLFGNVDKHGDKAWKTSKFYADFTVDLAIGAGTTALSSLLTSAATGAVAGSVVPGVGTIIGAGAGLLAGIVSAWFFNGTNTGQGAKEWASNKLSAAYSWSVRKWRKASSWVGEKAQGLFKGAKKMFGFG